MEGLASPFSLKRAFGLRARMSSPVPVVTTAKRLIGLLNSPTASKGRSITLVQREAIDILVEGNEGSGRNSGGLDEITFSLSHGRNVRAVVPVQNVEDRVLSLWIRAE